MSMQLSPILVYVEFKKTISLEGIVLAMYFCFQKQGGGLLFWPAALLHWIWKRLPCGVQGITRTRICRLFFRPWHRQKKRFD